MARRHVGIGLVVALGMAPWAAGPRADSLPATEIGSRRELFVDSHMIESSKEVRLVLHPPQWREVALRFDNAWEGPLSAYVTVFQDGPLCRMYYRGSAREGSQQVTCYAESPDGIRWTKPNLGLVEFEGSTQNNIIQADQGNGVEHNFAAFKDARPGVPVSEQYKALGGSRRAGGLFAYVSADAIRWRKLTDGPVITQGAFDSQNLAFWDPNRGVYAAYFRIFTGGVRAIATATSQDFTQWTTPVPIDLGDTPREHFYTNATLPYFRAPHYYFAFPKRFEPRRQRLPDHTTQGISEGVFLSSRDGVCFDRTFLETFVRPGRDRLNWGDRSNMPAWGLIQTAPDEMSIYASQHYRYPSHHLRRGVLRLDGIASAQAGSTTGELVTRPLRFRGKELVLNYATSASGSIQVEILDPQGAPISGRSLAEAKLLYGDEIEEVYSWKAGPDLSSLAGQPVKLRFLLKDADLYAYRFRE